MSMNNLISSSSVEQAIAFGSNEEMLKLMFEISFMTSAGFTSGALLLIGMVYLGLLAGSTFIHVTEMIWSKYERSSSRDMDR